MGGGGDSFSHLLQVFFKMFVFTDLKYMFYDASINYLSYEISIVFLLNL